MNKLLALAIIMFFIMAAVPSASADTDAEGSNGINAATEYPNGWTHRPVMEHFTGLSCPPCMNGAHPDATRIWEEEGYTEGNPWNYIEFHELNGGGEDDLMTLDARDRMFFYQTGSAGTPCLQVDGGYVELGGHSANGDANYDDMKQGLKDSGERDQIKKINVNVGAIFDGKSFSIKVEIDYLQNDEAFFPTPDEPFPDDTLRGTLYVYMIEDYVTAWSKTLEKDVECHNVFREYALQDVQFEMQPGDETVVKYAEWDVPDTMIRELDDNDEPIVEPIRVPINPVNVYPLAVVYDLDDRDSGRGDGSSNEDGDGGDGAPRELNSATPASTAYDNDNDPPTITLEKPSSSDGKVQINAMISDDGGELTAAYVVYREFGKNDSQWKYKELKIEGEECTDDVCTIGSGEAYAVLNISDSKKVEYSIMAYDGNWTKGSSEIAVASVSSSDDDGISMAMVGGVIGILALIGAGVFYMNSRQNPDDLDDYQDNADVSSWSDEVEREDLSTTEEEGGTPLEGEETEVIFDPDPEEYSP